ncbi:MAG TPA: HNH endonuclease [Pyrinomonadaceae bacterium]|jgi:hypothetical protein|nr:HNH endonuclease [Pyrinomonadaceae bacterium]
MPSKKTKAQQASNKGIVKASKKGKQPCPYAALAPKYAKLVNGSRPWRWTSVGKKLSKTDRKKIREIARKNKLIIIVPISAKRYPTFPSSTIKADHKRLPQNLWSATDAKQFGWLNRDLAARNPNYDAKTQTFKNDPLQKKYTWHHHQDKGRMQLVEFGVHNNTSHDGGRTTWAKGKRK